MSKIEYTPQLPYQRSIPVHGNPEGQTSPPEFESSPRSTYNRTSLRRIREVIRAPLAEFLGTALFVLIGTASDCQAVLSSNPQVSPAPRGTFLSLDFGWAIGLALAIWVSAGISGGHINPAITIASAVWNKFSWKKVPVYILAQVAGGFVGAGLTYGQYLTPINIYEGGSGNRTIATAGLFAPFPSSYFSPLPLFTSELIGTAILAFMIMATTDKHNAAPDLCLLPIAIFLIVLGLGVAWGMETYSFNPARDFGCRLFLSTVGYGGVLFKNHGHYWLWAGFIAPTLGAVIAFGVYDLLLRVDDPIQTVTRDNLKSDA